MLRPYTLPSEEDGRQIALDALAVVIHDRAKAQIRKQFTKQTGKAASNRAMREEAQAAGMAPGFYHQVYANFAKATFEELLDTPAKIRQINLWGDSR